MFFKNFKSYFCILLLVVSYSSTSFSNSFVNMFSKQDKQVPKNKNQVVLSYAPLVKKVSPAVVNIYNKRIVEVKTVSPLWKHPLFKNFFSNNPLNRNDYGLVKRKIENSLGSGVIVSKEGHIITSSHVISGSSEITVYIPGRGNLEAKILANDKKTDLAVLKVTTVDMKLPFLELMDSDLLEVGDIVLAIGNPFGVGQTVTAGIVSAVARNAIGISDYQFFIQTDAAINPGNSGGALVAMNGKLVGINTAIFSRSGGSDGIGFAVPSNIVRAILRNRTADGKIVRPWVGIVPHHLIGSTNNTKKAIGQKGVLIHSVYKGSPAAKAGLEKGDIILLIDGYKVANLKALRFRLATYEIGSSTVFRVLHKGKLKDYKVKILPPPENPKRDIRKISSNKTPLGGVKIANLSPALSEEIDVKDIEGVIVLNKGNSSASIAGFKNKDIIKDINGVKIKSSSQLENLLKKNENILSWKITFEREDHIVTVIISGW